LISSFVDKIAASLAPTGDLQRLVLRSSGSAVSSNGTRGCCTWTFGAEVEKYYWDGHIREIAEYCESDVLNTYRVWLRYELFRGRLSDAEFQGSETNLVEFVKARENTKPHLNGLM
jgi:predicted PolB exonuclease-like 3'-5' exonuclease